MEDCPWCPHDCHVKCDCVCHAMEDDLWPLYKD